MVAEPKSRQEFMHCYEINPASLNAAITLGLSSDQIIDKLSLYNKMKHISMEVQDYIRETTSSFGKAKLVLKDNRYFIECEDKQVIDFYKTQDALTDCWLDESEWKIGAHGEEEEVHAMNKPDTKNAKEIFTASSTLSTTVGFGHEQMRNMTSASKKESNLDKLLLIREKDDFIEKYEKLINEVEEYEDSLPARTVFRLEIHPKMIDKVKTERTNLSSEDKFKYMLTQEYDYKRETVENPLLEFRLNTHVKIRPYQEKALSRMFVEGRARSGIIVLPCGAGKTLVGILAMERIKRRTLILCINNLTVIQWEKQIKQFTNLEGTKIHKFISKSNEDRSVPDLNQPCIVISTYTMISRSDEGRGEYSKEFIEKLGQVEWGLLLLDEVQVAPAEVFKKAFLIKTKSHCKLGLTATLVREDEKIEDLQFYIGPKLYEESWQDLTNQGFLARVLCEEIRVTMTDEFQKTYREEGGMTKNMKTFLYSGNPNKFLVIQYLIDLHVKKGHKILVFIDSIDILIEYAKKLSYPYMCGDVKDNEREKLLKFFQELANWNVLFVSRVGDVGIDLPDANVAIEVTSQFGSRRQEAQRLGRILRPKETREGKYQAFFYTLVSIGTDEVRYAVQRQKFLVQQGYSFKITQEESLPYNKNPKLRRKMKMADLKEQSEFLQKLFALSLRKENDREKKKTAIESDDDDSDEHVPVVKKNILGKSTAGALTYIEKND